MALEHRLERQSLCPLKYNENIYGVLRVIVITTVMVQKVYYLQSGSLLYMEQNDNLSTN